MICPLCGSSKTQPESTIRADVLIARWKEDFQIDIASEFQGNSLIELVYCSNCALRFFQPSSIVGSPALYEHLDRYDWYYEPRKWEYDVALRDLKGFRRVLEIGCGSGSFLELAVRETGANIEGLEQNEDAIKEATNRGLRASKATAEEIAQRSPGLYDAICSFQVLEHVSSPAVFFNACCSLLRPGGRLLLGLPNADSFLKYEFNLLDLPPHHMSRWSRSVLSRIPTLFPLVLSAIAYEPLPESRVEAYVNSYFSLFKGPLAPLHHPYILSRLSRIMRRPFIRKWLRGQTIYVRFDRL
jgi:SAM-dependent methyltransferase